MPWGPKISEPKPRNPSKFDGGKSLDFLGLEATAVISTHQNHSERGKNPPKRYFLQSSKKRTRRPTISGSGKHADILFGFVSHHVHTSGHTAGFPQIYVFAISTKMHGKLAHRHTRHVCGYFSSQDLQANHGKP